MAYLMPPSPWPPPIYLHTPRAKFLEGLSEGGTADNEFLAEAGKGHSPLRLPIELVAHRDIVVHGRAAEFAMVTKGEFDLTSSS